MNKKETIKKLEDLLENFEDRQSAERSRLKQLQDENDATELYHEGQADAFNEAGGMLENVINQIEEL